MTRRLAAAALSLYPVAFRRRYGEEMRALLDESPPRLRTVFDLLRGALAAHLRPTAAAENVVDPADRLRASTSGQLACWVLFAAAGFAFYNTTEDDPFMAAGRVHPLLAVTHDVVQVMAILASTAVLIGALPLVTAALTQATRVPGMRRLVWRAPFAVLLFAGLTALVALRAHSQAAHSGTAGGLVFIAWGLAGLVCGAVCVLSARAALFALPLSRARLITAFACGTLLTVAMAAIALATALYAIALTVDSSPLAASPNGPFQLLSTRVSLIVQLLVMVLAAGLAATTTRRGWRAVMFD
jgi:hypothetical protein